MKYSESLALASVSLSCGWYRCRHVNPFRVHMNLHQPKWTLQWLTSNLPVTCQWLIGDSSVEQLNGRVERKLLPITCSVVALNNINQYHIIISWHLLLRSFKLLVSSHVVQSVKECKIMYIRSFQIALQTMSAASFFTPTSACGSFLHCSQQPMFGPVLVRMFLPIPNGAHQVGRSQNGDFRCFRRSHGRPSHISHRSPASVFYAPPLLHVTEFE